MFILGKMGGDEITALLKLIQLHNLTESQMITLPAFLGTAQSGGRGKMKKTTYKVITEEQEREKWWPGWGTIHTDVEMWAASRQVSKIGCENLSIRYGVFERNGIKGYPSVLDCSGRRQRVLLGHVKLELATPCPRPYVYWAVKWREHCLLRRQPRASPPGGMLEAYRGLASQAAPP